jgi:hypothetical protein
MEVPTLEEPMPPNIIGNFGLKNQLRPSYTSSEEFALVFSDEFNIDGRTFYLGDDLYWELISTIGPG